MEQQVVKCPICGEPYVFFAYYCGDQSVCSECRAKAYAKLNEAKWEIN